MNKLKIITTFLATVALVPLMAAGTSSDSASSSEFGSVNILLGVIALIQIIGILTLTDSLKNLARKSANLIELKKQIESKNSASTGALKSVILLIIFLGITNLSQALSVAAPVVNSTSMDTTTMVLIILNAVLFFVFLYLVRLVYKTVATLIPAEPEKSVKAESKHEKQSVLSKVLVDAVPVEEEESIMLDHDYDGIQELDNNLPPWWVWMFYATIIFSFVYLAYYWILPYGQSQQEEYVAEVNQAAIDKEAYLATVKDKVDENTVTYLDSPADLGAGKNIYTANCQACHAPDGGGGVGPNLTDEYWLHGGSIQDIFKTVKYGVPAKGMIPWETQLNPKQMAQVTSYIHSLNGTAPAAPKDPQGEIWTPENSQESATDSVVTAISDTTITESAKLE